MYPTLWTNIRGWGKRGVVIENMNCKSFSDFPRWKGVMENILDKYRGSQEPALIILFGQEAWASYLSLNDSVTGEVPVMCALTSRNVVLLPDDGKIWHTGCRNLPIL